MTRDEAPARLRELLGPFRDRAVKEFDVPDIQDAIGLYGNYHDDPSDDELEAMVEQAGWDLLIPLGDVFVEEQ
jgi:hypothetical protein